MKINRKIYSIKHIPTDSYLCNSDIFYEFSTSKLDSIELFIHYGHAEQTLKSIINQYEIIVDGIYIDVNSDDITIVKIKLYGDIGLCPTNI